MAALPVAFASEPHKDLDRGVGTSFGSSDSEASYDLGYSRGLGSRPHVSSAKTHATIYDVKDRARLQVRVSNQGEAPVRVLVELSGMGVEPADGAEERVNADDELVVLEHLRLQAQAESAVDVIVHVEGHAQDLDDVEVSVSWSPEVVVNQVRKPPRSLNVKGERSGGGAAPIGPIKPKPDDAGKLTLPGNLLEVLEQGQIDVPQALEFGN